MKIQHQRRTIRSGQGFELRHIHHICGKYQIVIPDLFDFLQKMQGRGPHPPPPVFRCQGQQCDVMPGVGRKPGGKILVGSPEKRFQKKHLHCGSPLFLWLVQAF